MELLDVLKSSGICLVSQSGTAVKSVPHHCHYVTHLNRARLAPPTRGCLESRAETLQRGGDILLIRNKTQMRHCRPNQLPTLGSNIKLCTLRTCVPDTSSHRLLLFAPQGRTRADGQRRGRRLGLLGGFGCLRFLRGFWCFWFFGGFWRFGLFCRLGGFLFLCFGFLLCRFLCPGFTEIC